jgi:hypothetical protein
MLVVVCYVCVLYVVVVTSPFSYLTGRGNANIGPAKMADESALITKNESLPYSTEHKHQLKDKV